AERDEHAAQDSKHHEIEVLEVNVRRLILVAVIAVVGGVLGVPTLAQQQPAQTPPAGTPTFRTTTRLIVNTVTVKDKDGKPIEGLTAKDFVVTEDNEPQMISFVEFQRLPPPRGTGNVSVGEATPEAAPAAAAKPAAPEKPKVESATDVKIATGTPGDIKYRNKRLMILYFDMTAMPPADLLRAYNAAV